ncbi:bifunctional proline dehydrogenase/L-glutamate gamma-semialdehyde dehydrogenase PutA [Thalassotalea litorea]|uniref:bifunctional proline dehydrogenase/L-glutamate gamma-semialdehyde dehydrogenase PutA n=1 Tax=Thalassotalea litorea TaxID=2020715 RepID=UPI00373703F3
MLFNGNLITSDPIRQQIRDHYRADENQVLANLLPIAEISPAAKSRAWERARQLVLEIRKDQIGKGGVDALLNEFALSTDEGVVLMCLAEALLRVPDKKTADSLIRDKLAEGDWSAHIGNSDSIFVNASSWGLLLTGKMVNYTDTKKKEQFGLLKKTIGRLGEPVIRKAVRYAMQVMGTQFVMGRKIDAAVERAKKTEQKGYTYSYDMLGEGARTMSDADRYFESYMNAIHAIGKAANSKGPQQSPGISIKLSAIHPRYEFTHRERVLEELIPRLKQLALAAKSYDIGFTVDAEEADRLDISLDVIGAVFSDTDLDGWNGFGIAVQAYQKRALYVIEWVRQQTEAANRQMMVRLVKGAYWDSEIKISQVEGYEDFPVFSRKPSTDVSYQACAKRLLSYRDTIYPQFATHNAYTVATILEMTDDHSGFEFQRLHGMGESLYDQVVTKDKVACRVYAPVGEHADLLAYLVRRLLENGANSSFVNNIVDEDIPVESLLLDPVEQVQSWVNKYNPQIPQSIDIYGSERANSKGIDLTNVDQVSTMRDNLDNWFNSVTANAHEKSAGAEPVINPANHDEVIGYLSHLQPEQMTTAIDNAEAAFANWSQTPVSERATLLRKTADALEANRDELIALCIKEAGKIPVDGVAEVREAVDFCRYYAARAETMLPSQELESRGVVLCISPWNFPLAIFLGQVAAAVVTGNTVVAKPAEQTSLIALRTIELMKQSGMPENVVVPIIARGSQVGAHVVPDPRIQAVMFTGSTETGTWISQKLAERQGHQVPLIAETGGQNCMIVDSTALPEQVVDDVIASGFQSAGQRCSALRVLFLQEDIADKVITMIKGAMQELHVGDPAMLATDVGPVIDSKAYTALNNHVEYLKDKATLHYQCEIPEMGDTGNFFFAPRLYEIADLSVLTKEVFGPCVHVVRFKEKDLDNVIDQINGTGFGLTMGIHTRIEDKSEYLAKRSRAGNIYVNRNMIGAVVGVQPFGGRGLSGTGPKAGGPMYLTRLVKEKVSVKTSLTNADAVQEITNSKPCGELPVDDIMNRAKADERNWSMTDIHLRSSIVRQLLATLASNRIVQAQESDLEQALQAARAQLNAFEKTLSKPIELPGPTGESNKLYLESRGTMIAVRDTHTSFEYWLVSVVSSLVAGNTVVCAVADEYVNEAIALEGVLQKLGLVRGIFQVISLSQLPEALAHSALAGAICGPQSALVAYLAEQLAARSGAILPVISPVRYDALLHRLVTEKTVTIDTTAAGGNASLMTMEDA